MVAARFWIQWDRAISAANRKAKSGDIDGAIADLRAILAMEPPTFLRLNALGNFLIGQDRHAEALEAFPAAKDFDFVLFDCPPGISMFAEAAIELSEFVVIPTIPDYVSRLGIFAFRKRALRSMEQRRFTDDRIWTLVTKYEANNTLHQSEAALLREQFNVFTTMIPQAEQIARAAEWSEAKRTLEQKYGETATVIRKFAGEFRERVGLI